MKKYDFKVPLKGYYQITITANLDEDFVLKDLRGKIPQIVSTEVVLLSYEHYKGGL